MVLEDGSSKPASANPKGCCVLAGLAPPGGCRGRIRLSLWPLVAPNITGLVAAHGRTASSCVSSSSLPGLMRICESLASTGIISITKVTSAKSIFPNKLVQMYMVQG